MRGSPGQAFGIYGTHNNNCVMLDASRSPPPCGEEFLQDVARLMSTTPIAYPSPQVGRERPASRLNRAFIRAGLLIIQRAGDALAGDLVPAPAEHRPFRLFPTGEHRAVLDDNRVGALRRHG